VVARDSERLDALWCFVVLCSGADGVQVDQNTLYSPTEPRLSHFFPSVDAGFSGSVVKSGSVLSFRYTQLCSIDAGCRMFSTYLLGIQEGQPRNSLIISINEKYFHHVFFSCVNALQAAWL
jgi:hypothetical protein